jgi:hypothetical protein
VTSRLDALEERSKSQPFRGFQCWAPSEVGAIMHREAAAPSRAVLLATHQPPRIRQVTVTEAGRFGSDELVTQDEVLQAVMSEDDPSLIVPVIGASGSGKSHLVLWMRAKLEEAGSPNRKIIYLPKGETSLAGVIERLLDGRTGGAFDQIREAVSKASRTMTPAEAARRLRDELAVAAGGLDEASGGPARAPFRKHIKDNIAKLLDDPVYSERLTGDSGPLRRIVDQARAGGSEEPAELKPEDLDVTLTAVELEPLSQPAKQFLGDLKTPVLHEEAITVLNEVRDRCLSRVFGVEPMQLVTVMRQLRERLYEENPNVEIILMIEDFTLLQGIQHDLLEAMIELPTREGKQVLAGMKTVMAVTDGFFTRMLVSSDTLRTRIASQGHVYNLDVQYGAESTGALDQAGVIQFVGRYLNAVRVGSEGLDDAAPEVPNACDRCAHRDRCHDSFGTSDELEFGLYPFSAPVVDRMVRSRQDKFNPRDLLAALSQTLTTHADEITDGRFPSPGWARMFNTRRHDRPALPSLRLTVQEQVNALPKAEQRTVLLNFWGGTPDELRNLHPGVHEAFDVPLAPDAATVVPVIRPVGPQPVPDPIGGGDDIELAVQSWRDGGELAAPEARILRRVFRDAITGAADTEARLYSPQFVKEFFDQDTDIQIDNARGAARPNKRRFSVEFPAKPPAVANENAILFQGVLRVQSTRGWSFEGGHDALVAFMARVDTEAARMRDFLDARLAERQAVQDATIKLLALSGLAAGQGSATDARGLLAAAFSGNSVVSEQMPDRWRTLINQLDGRRAGAREFTAQGVHVSKSTSEPAGLDGSRYLGALSDLKSNWALPELPEDAPQPVLMLRRVLEERLGPALDEAREKVAEWDAEVVRLVGDVETLGERARVWRDALERARQAGFLVSARGYNADANLAQLASTARAARALVVEWESWDLGRRIVGVAKIPWARLTPLREELVGIEAALVASHEKARTQATAERTGSPVEQFAEALDRLAQAARIGAPSS